MSLPVSASIPSCDSIQSLFGTLAPPELFARLRERFGLHDQGIYVAPVVIWLMMWQQLRSRTLAEAVQQVVLGEPRGLLPPHKRVCKGTVSSNTGAYSEGRRKLPREVVEEVFDHVFQEALKRSPGAGLAARAYLLDGSALRLPHTPELVRQFPPTSNQHGPSHWPLLRVAVGHNLANGAAVLPQWGPLNGKQAVSEQSLAEKIMGRLPRRSILVADRNFGVFSIAWGAQCGGHHLVVRMTKARAQRLMGGTLPKRNAEREVTWTPSREDRRQHPEIPADAMVHGRLIIQHVRRHRQVIVLYLFTTLDLPAEQIVELYGWRWNIETDLRSLKQTLNLEQLRCKSPAMVAKELMTAVLAYNLVRVVQGAAAQWAGVPCRQLSFAHAQAVVHTWLPRLLAATSPEEFHTLMQRMLRAVAYGKLPKRKRRRCYPRAVWGRPQVFPRRKAAKKASRSTYGKK